MGEQLAVKDPRPSAPFAAAGSTVSNPVSFLVGGAADSCATAGV
jgi:hypothetical protein